MHHLFLFLFLFDLLDEEDERTTIGQLQYAPWRSLPSWCAKLFVVNKL